MLALHLRMLHVAHDVDAAEERASTRRRNMAMPLALLTEEKFRKRYRLSTELFSQLVEELRPHISAPRRSDGLDVETKILITLSFYATGSYQTLVGDCTHHPVSQATVSKVVNEVTEAFNHPDVMNRHVKFPFRRSERLSIKRRFYRATRLPGVLGCVGSTHVVIVKPTLHEERYINRKGYHSLNVLIMCDSNLNIINVDPSYPGSTHDSKVWEGNVMRGYIEKLYEENQEDVYILGDSAYPLRSTLLTPILHAESGSPESHYTELHVTARSIVERCIGVLKARFRCLLVNRKLHYKPVTAAKMVNACCALHNIAHAAGIQYEPLTAAELQRERELKEPASVRRQAREGAGPAARAARARDLRAGRERRDAVMHMLWQQKHIFP